MSKDIRNELRNLKREIVKGQNREPICYDPSDYITDMEDVELVLVFKGTYYKKKDAADLSKVLSMFNHELDSRKLRRLIDDKSKWNYLWALGIGTHYIKMTASDKYYICTDGNVLKKNLHPIRRNMYNSYVEVVLNGERQNVNRAVMVFEYFVEDDIYENELYFISGDMSDCSIDNISRKTRKR